MTQIFGGTRGRDDTNAILADDKIGIEYRYPRVPAYPMPSLLSNWFGIEYSMSTQISNPISVSAKNSQYYQGFYPIWAQCRPTTKLASGIQGYRYPMPSLLSNQLGIRYLMPTLILYRLRLPSVTGVHDPTAWVFVCEY